MSPTTPARRHVWVDCSGGYTCPGLVMAWRREPSGWQAQVAVVRDRTVFVQWTPASALHPVVDDGWAAEQETASARVVRRPSPGASLP